MSKYWQVGVKVLAGGCQSIGRWESQHWQVGVTALAGRCYSISRWRVTALASGGSALAGECHSIGRWMSKHWQVNVKALAGGCYSIGRWMSKHWQVDVTALASGCWDASAAFLALYYTYVSHTFSITSLYLMLTLPVISLLMQVQDVTPITSFDVAGTNLLLGCRNGSIYYIDMQKFPLRMKGMRC